MRPGPGSPRGPGSSRRPRVAWCRLDPGVRGARCSRWARGGMTWHRPSRTPCSRRSSCRHGTTTLPDGSQVRLLLGLSAGSMAHFELGAGEVSRPLRHRTVGEIWYVVQGLGQMWRHQDGAEASVQQARPAPVHPQQVAVDGRQRQALGGVGVPLGATREGRVKKRPFLASLRSRGAPTRPPWRRSPAGPRRAGRRPPGRRW
jgi:hypothetical protein